MASVDDCDAAFRAFADRLSASNNKPSDLDRTLTCRLPDIGVIFAGHLHDGKITDIRQVDNASAQVKLTMSSDDLVDLVEGRTRFASAWASGRIKSDARVFDLIKLRSVF